MEKLTFKQAHERERARAGRERRNGLGAPVCARQLGPSASDTGHMRILEESQICEVLQ